MHLARRSNFFDAEVIRRFGPRGILSFASAYGLVGAITDDTQLTLFTAEGLLRAAVRLESKGICDIPSIVHHSYLRWLKTQGETTARETIPIGMDGWLIDLPSLRSRRAPGATCLSSLREAQHLGDTAQNESKGCGTLMRIAPIGLVARADDAFELGCEVAALTHGHPSGALSAGFLAYLIRRIIEGNSLQNAIIMAKDVLRTHQNHAEVLNALNAAEHYAASRDLNALREGRLGEGWVAEEALAISVYCALLFRNFEEAVIGAVNHSGTATVQGQSQEISVGLFTVWSRSRNDGLANWNSGKKLPKLPTTWPHSTGAYSTHRLNLPGSDIPDTEQPLDFYPAQTAKTRFNFYSIPSLGFAASRCLQRSKFAERTPNERIHGFHAYIKAIGDLPIFILFKAQR